MEFTLKTRAPEAVARAVAKAERYRLLNEPAEAASICLDALAIEMPPGADPLEEGGVGRTDGIDTRIPAIRAPRQLILDQRNAQRRIAQGNGEAGTGKSAADDDQVKLLHCGD